MNIIEFSGLPGCGKSTLCKSFISQIGARKIYTYKDVIRFVSTPNRRKLYGVFVALNPFRWKFLRLLKHFVKNYDNVSMQAVFILMALYDFTSILRLIRNKSVVVLDEGFVQNLTSIAHLQVISDDKDLMELVQYIQAKNNILVINCLAEEDIVIGRLRKRNRADRFNSIKDTEQLRSALRIKQNNILSVLQCFVNKIDICVDGSTEEALEQLLKKF